MKKIFLTLTMTTGWLLVKAQIPQPDPDTTAKHFLIVASIGNLQEVNAGQLAIQKSKQADIKAFAQMMVKDHSDAEQQLVQLARQPRIDLPSQATGGIQPDLNLKNAGENFDKLYVHGMVNGHRNTVETFQTYAVNGKNATVKAFAQQILPKLKMHLEHIKAIDKQLSTK